jgi:phage terminase large subunit-like protein
VAAARKRKRTAKTKRTAPPPWWGEGPSPDERWPGVMLPIPATWNKARKRWESHGGRYYFDADAAAWAADFFPEMLVHHIGEFVGQPFVLLDYQRILIRAAFGWKRASDGFRRFRKVFLAVPKGNGKSPLCSGVGLYLTAFDNEAGAEVYAAAADKNQARIVFDTAKIMVEKSEKLGEAFEPYRDSLKVRGGTEYFQVVSSDAPTKHGFRPHGIVFDEFHAQPDRDLYDTLDRGTVKRRQPMAWLVTTAGDDDESICFEEWEYARRVISGSSAVEDETYLAMVFELTPKDDWTDLVNIRRVNPGFGVTVKADAIETAIKAAQNEPRKRNSFLQLHCNRWVNQAVSWIPVEWWDACEGAFPADYASLPCASGLDMAQKIDLVAFHVVLRQWLDGEAIRVEVVSGNDAGERDEMPSREEKHEVSLNFRIYSVPFFWLPEETVRDREREGFTAYRSWAELAHPQVPGMKLLTITEGGAIDYERVFQDIKGRIAEHFPLLKQGELGYDPAFATDIANKLRDKAGFQTVEVLQNYKHLSEPCQVFEALVKNRRWVHDGNRVLRWNVENVAVKRDDAGRIRPVKPKKATKKIDGVVSGLMGLARVMTQPDAMEVDTRVDVVG